MAMGWLSDASGPGRGSHLQSLKPRDSGLRSVVRRSLALGILATCACVAVVQIMGACGLDVIGDGGITPAGDAAIPEGLDSWMDLDSGSDALANIEGPDAQLDPRIAVLYRFDEKGGDTVTDVAPPQARRSRIDPLGSTGASSWSNGVLDIAKPIRIRSLVVPKKVYFAIINSEDQITVEAWVEAAKESQGTAGAPSPSSRWPRQRPQMPTSRSRRATTTGPHACV